MNGLKRLENHVHASQTKKSLYKNLFYIKKQKISILQKIFKLRFKSLEKSFKLLSCLIKFKPFQDKRETKVD
jgi:hypothetical protein